MSVADKLTTLSENITSAYESISSLSGTIPTYQNTQNIANAILTIPQYNPLTLAYISYGSADTAQNFVNLMVSNGTIPVGGASYAFAETTGLTSLDLSELDFSATTDTICMFNNATDLASITWADSVDFGNVESMQGMYRNTEALALVDLSAFETGEYLESLFNMFAGSGVQAVNLGGSFDTSAVTDFYGMFNSCENLTDLYRINNLRMDSAQDLRAMFYGCSAMTELDLGENNRGKSKNLLDTSVTAGTSNGVDYSIVDGKLTLDGTCSSDMVVVPLSSPISFPDSTVVISEQPKSGRAIGIASGTASSYTAIAVINSSTGVVSGNYAGGTGSVLVFYGLSGVQLESYQPNIQIELGSTATDYMPYGPYQLLTKQGLATPASDTDFWGNITAASFTPSNNGWGSFYGTGTSYLNMFIKKEATNMEAGTDYTMIFEVAEQSGTPFLTINDTGTGTILASCTNIYAEPESGGWTNYGWGGCVNGHYVVKATTKSGTDFDTATVLRIFMAGTSGRGAKIRLTILKGDHTDDWEDYAWQPYAFTPPTLSLSAANADYMLAGMTSLQSLDLSGWTSGSDDLASSNFWTTQSALTTLTLNGPKRLVDGKLADSLVATFDSLQGSTITTLTMNDPEFFTTDGTTATLTDFSDVWSGSALTTLEMTGWDVSSVDPTDNSATVTLTSVANLTTLTIGDWTTHASGVNLATLLGVDNDGSSGYSGAATNLTSLHLTGDTVFPVYNDGTGEFKSENAFVDCPIGDGTGVIYVPSDLVSSYQADSFWSAYSSIITAES